MTIPSGSGTEVLKIAACQSTSTNWTKMRWDQSLTAQGNTSTGTVAVPSDCIVTILNVSVCSNDAASTYIGIAKDISTATNLYIVHTGTILPAYGTFVYSDKIVLMPTDKLTIYNTGAVHFHFNYIYQDWT